MFCTMLWYIVVKIYISKSVPYFVPCYGALWYKYIFEKEGTSAKVSAWEQRYTYVKVEHIGEVGHIEAQIYICKSGAHR